MDIDKLNTKSPIVLKCTQCKFCCLNDYALPVGILETNLFQFLFGCPGGRNWSSSSLQGGRRGDRRHRVRGRRGPKEGPTAVAVRKKYRAMMLTVRTKEGLNDGSHNEGGCGGGGREDRGEEGDGAVREEGGCGDDDGEDVGVEDNDNGREKEVAAPAMEGASGTIVRKVDVAAAAVRTKERVMVSAVRKEDSVATGQRQPRERRRGGRRRRRGRRRWQCGIASEEGKEDQRGHHIMGGHDSRFNVARY